MEFITCPKCETLLHTNLDQALDDPDPARLREWMERSSQLLDNQGFSWNSADDKGNCPICNGVASPPPAGCTDIQELPVGVGLPQEQWSFLLHRAIVHFQQDMAMLGPRRPGGPRDHYLFAHRALMHYTLGGTVSRYGATAGFLGLLDPCASKAAFRILSHMVRTDGLETDIALAAATPQEAGEAVPMTYQANESSIHRYSLEDATVVVIESPPPFRAGETWFVAVVLGAELSSLTELVEGAKPPLLYLTLELAASRNRVQRTMLAQTHPDGSRTNYGIGCIPDKNALLRVVHVLWRSEIWKRVAESDAATERSIQFDHPYETAAIPSGVTETQPSSPGANGGEGSTDDKRNKDDELAGLLACARDRDAPDAEWNDCMEAVSEASVLYLAFEQLKYRKQQLAWSLLQRRRRLCEDRCAACGEVSLQRDKQGWVWGEPRGGPHGPLFPLRRPR